MAPSLREGILSRLCVLLCYSLVVFHLVLDSIELHIVLPQSHENQAKVLRIQRFDVDL